MRILVTGGGGYIGTTVVPYLLNNGCHVTVLDRFYFGRDLCEPILDDHEKNLELVSGDIRDIPKELFEGIDITIDLAGISNDPSCELDPELTRQINYEGSIRVGKLAAEAGVKHHIFASSCSIYGQGQHLQLTEESPPNPLTIYAKCKLGVENKLFDIGQNTDLVVTTPRFATVFGLSKRMRFDLAVNIMTKRAYLQDLIEIYGGGKQWRPFVHVKDIARALWYIIQADSARVANRRFNVGGDNLNYQIEQLGYEIGSIIPNTDVKPVSSDPDTRSYNVSFERIRTELEFRPKYDIEYGVREIVDAISSGLINPHERRWQTIEQYQFLKEAEPQHSDLNTHDSIL